MWNQKSSSRICADKVAVKTQQKHLLKLLDMKPQINNSTPFVPNFLKTRAKQEKMKEIRQSEIQYENMKILRKMVEIETKPGPLNPYELKRKSFHPSRSGGVLRKMLEWQKINEENRGLVQRLQSTHSIYDTNKWESEERKRQELSKRLSQNGSKIYAAINLLIDSSQGRYEHLDLTGQALSSLSRPFTSISTSSSHRYSSPKGIFYRSMELPY